MLGRQIKTVTVKNNEPIKETSKQKSMTFDVSVEFNNGELADIELQSEKEEYDFGSRAEIQAARLLTNNAKRGSNWISEKVYQISILNFQYKNDDNKEMSKADNNWYIQNSIWVAKRDEQARKAAAREKGLAEGRAQGLAEGRAEGKTESLVSSIKNVMDSIHVSIEEAMDILKVDPQKRQEYAAKVK